MKIPLVVALLLGATNSLELQSKSKAVLAKEYIDMVYAQVESDAERRRRRRRPMPPKPVEIFGLPPGPVTAELRGDNWPCSSEEPCGVGEGTCFNPYETTMHPDEWCVEPLYCQQRNGALWNRNTKGESVLGVEFTGKLKIHHNGANDICYDPDFGTDTPGVQTKVEMARLRKKYRPCSKEDKCDIGQGSCEQDDNLCAKGLKCAFRLGGTEFNKNQGEAVHGIVFDGDLKINDTGHNDICYNPKWPDPPDHDYEGKLVRSILAGGAKSCGDNTIYLILDGVRRPVPDTETYDGMWDSYDYIIERPEHAFAQYPVYPAMCEGAQLLSDWDHPHEVFLVIDQQKRLIENEETMKHMNLTAKKIDKAPDCFLHAIKTGPMINYKALAAKHAKIAAAKEGLTIE